MKTEFTAKYLQHLNSKKREGGFTLIELLVVIIIVGVLAAIALPSFLNQIGKARGSEAKAAIGTVNRAQQTYRLEQNTMANDINALDAKITGKFYDYAIPADTTTISFANVLTTTQQPDLKAYAGAVSQITDATGGETFLQVVCESDVNVADNGTATAITTGQIGAVLSTPDDPTDDCDAAYKKID